MNLCQDIPAKIFEKLTKFGGPDIIIQVDECLLRVSRKNHIGDLYFIIEYIMKYNFLLNINY